MAAPVSPPTRRRRRWLVRIGLLLLALGVVVWFAPVVVARTGFRQVVLARAFADLNGTVTAGDATFGWLSPVELRDVRVTDTQGKTVLTAERISTFRTLLDLVRDQSDLGKIVVEHPVVEVSCEPGTTNVEGVLRNWLTGEPSAAGGRIGVEVEVARGRFVLTETGRADEQVLDPVNLTATVPRSSEEAIAITVLVGEAGTTGSLRSSVSIHADTTVELNANAFPIETLGPLVTRLSSGTTAAGSLTTDLRVRWGPGDPGRDRLAASATTLRVDGLDLAGPWLGPDRLRLARLECPAEITLDAGELRIVRSALACDVGTASVSGAVSLDESPEQWLARPGVSVAADLDVARLTAVLPRLLRIREGTRLSDGRVSVRLASKAGPGGAQWDGSVKTTSLRGTRAGKPLSWEHPLSARFEGRLREDGLPVLSRLEAQSDFIGLAARGSPEAFEAAANLNLDRLATRLGEFVDLRGFHLGGMAAVTLQTGPRAGGGTVASGSLILTRFTFTDGAGRNLHEAEVTADFRAAGAITRGGPIRIDEATATVNASGDRLTLALAGPIGDVRTRATGRGTAVMSGELGRWRMRLGSWVGVPPEWEVRGAGDVTATIDLSPESVRVDARAPNLRGVRFRGGGVALDERWLKLETRANWRRESGAVELTDVVVHCDTIVVTTPRFDLAPAPGGGYSANGTATVTANVNRVQRAFGLQTDPGDGDAVNGLAKGTATLTVGPASGFDVKFDVEGLMIGPPSDPVWKEPLVRLAAVGTLDRTSDGIRFKALTVSRDGLVLDSTGSFLNLATTRDLSLSGKMTYDLAKLEPQLRVFLGKDARAVGKDTKPFDLSGRLGETVRVAVGTRSGPVRRSPVEALTGHAIVSWQQVRAYGFEVGPGEMRTELARGVVASSPVDATFGGGRARLTPRVDLRTKDYDLMFARGRIVENARVTPAVCASALGYVLPAIANAAQADGLVSFDLEENAIPLNDVDRTTLRGRLTMHKATISPGPILTEVATLLGARQTTHTLATEQVIPVRVEGGRVYHENFAMTVGKGSVVTSGSVGFDGSLALVLEMPIPERLIERAFPRQATVREVLLKQRVKVPVGGTLSRPQLDPRAFESATNQLLRAAAQSATRELIQKGEDKLLDELRKRLGQPPTAPKK